MWDLHSWCCFLPQTFKKHPHDPTENLLLITQPQNDAAEHNCISFSAFAVMLMSWLNRRRRRYFLLILCSPFLIPLLFATCPFICAVEVCLLMCRRRRNAAATGGGDRRSGFEEGGDEVGLLQRYLEDQMLLVLGSVDDDENKGQKDGVDVEYFDSVRPLMQ
ncbi:hypothetical protein ACJIZ3_019121 [Penstemon smallii]|uniref:Transmembrane protein n=1 Tax=Penstemon smallii TaxID=265156 RepID=A0ABD3T092_9LAMI